MGLSVNNQLSPRASGAPKSPKSMRGSQIKRKLAHLKAMWPLELDGAPGEGPMEPLEQESMGPFVDNGGP